MVHFYAVTYSWPDPIYRNGELYADTAHSGFTAEFSGPVTEEAWPTIAEWVEKDRGIGPVTITSVRPAPQP